MTDEQRLQMITEQLILVRDNLFRGMSKSIQKLQARSINELLELPSHTQSPPAQQEPVAKVCHDLDGHIGWNPNLRQLPDEGTALYTSPPAQRKPLTDEECDRIYTALDQWAREFDQYEFGLPTHCGDGMIGGRAIIRAAHGIKENT